ncbi:50S ribosomal protein L21 [Chitinophaga lutea]|nr:50S ribosomal protein L21 [Chitinophaga lutea]
MICKKLFFNRMTAPGDPPSCKKVLNSLLIKKQSNTFAGNYFWNIMFAVVKIAGQQFKVQKDQEIFVQQLSGNVGDKVEFAEVLLTDNDGKVTVGTDVKSVIKAEILGHVQGDKVIAFKMKRRKGFRKKVGHRTHFTKIKINEIA